MKEPVLTVLDLNFKKMRMEVDVSDYEWSVKMSNKG